MHTVYQLFVRERGLRTEYVELLSRDDGDVAQVLEVTGGELPQTRLSKLTRLLILEDDCGQVPEPLREDCRASLTTISGTRWWTSTGRWRMWLTCIRGWIPGTAGI